MTASIRTSQVFDSDKVARAQVRLVHLDKEQTFTGRLKGFLGGRWISYSFYNTSDRKSLGDWVVGLAEVVVQTDQDFLVKRVNIKFYFELISANANFGTTRIRVRPARFGVDITLKSLTTSRTPFIMRKVIPGLPSLNGTLEFF